MKFATIVDSSMGIESIVLNGTLWCVIISLCLSTAVDLTSVLNSTINC